MGKIWLFAALFLAYLCYSLAVYTRGTDNSFQASAEAQEGKRLFQKYNCSSCHQVYGLGGYLGPELTTAWSDPHRGEHFIRAFLQAGGRTMPNFHLDKNEVEALAQYMKYIDSTAVSYKNQATGK
jgi:nitric oxide reductase subunit C